MRTCSPSSPTSTVWPATRRQCVRRSPKPCRRGRAIPPSLTARETSSWAWDQIAIPCCLSLTWTRSGSRSRTSLAMEWCRCERGVASSPRCGRDKPRFSTFRTSTCRRATLAGAAPCARERCAVCSCPATARPASSRRSSPPGSASIPRASSPSASSQGFRSRATNARRDSPAIASQLARSTIALAPRRCSWRLRASTARNSTTECSLRGRCAKREGSRGPKRLLSSTAPLYVACTLSTPLSRVTRLWRLHALHTRRLAREQSRARSITRVSLRLMTWTDCYGSLARHVSPFRWAPRMVVTMAQRSRATAQRISRWVGPSATATPPPKSSICATSDP
jgi:hypothetical protein